MDLGTRTRDAGKFTSEERVWVKVKKEDEREKSGWDYNQNEVSV
jgi:hypothetical protein